MRHHSAFCQFVYSMKNIIMLLLLHNRVSFKRGVTAVRIALLLSLLYLIILSMTFVSGPFRLVGMQHRHATLPSYHDCILDHDDLCSQEIRKFFLFTKRRMVLLT